MQHILPEIPPRQRIGQTVKKLVQIMPIPISGLLLGILSTGNMLSTYGSIFKTIAALIFALVTLILILKVIYYTDTFIKDLQNPFIAGTAFTFPMAIVVLSTYIYPFWSVVGSIVCGLGVLMHFILMLYYTKKYLFNLIYSKCFLIILWFMLVLQFSA